MDRAEALVGLNVFTSLHPESALAAARDLDDRIAAGIDPGPLAGVTIALKDLIDQAGLITTAGSSFLDRTATVDAEVVARLNAAGAVIIGRTGLHEFAYGFSSENDWWGPVRNPWNPATSPGGSSGGSASAVAAGITPLGIGTDTGGSVRVPAAMCGVVGLKVTHGRIPLTGVFPLAASLDTVGPITRTVTDAALAYSVLAGHDPSDPWSVESIVEPVTPVALGSLTIGVPHPWVDLAIAPEQHRGLGLTLQVLEAAGAVVHHFDEPVLTGEIPPGAYAEVADVHRTWFLEDPSQYGVEIRTRVGAVLDLDSDAVARAKTWRNEVVQAFNRAWTRFDVVVTPTTAARLKPIGVTELDVGAGPEPYRPLLSRFTALVNQAGLPALALPVEAPEVIGLPPSVQLIGPAWSEARLLGIGLELEGLGLVAHRVAPDVTRTHRQAYNAPAES